MHSRIPCAALLVCGSLLATACDAPSAPDGFAVVEPVTGSVPPPGVEPPGRAAGSPASLQLAAGQYFTYALPQGWRVGEDGQFALTLLAPDNKAVTIMVGNAGMPTHYPTAQYAYERLMAIRPQNLQLGSPRQAQPIAGFAQALEFPVSYMVDGVPCLGLATVHYAPAYDSATFAMTAALSDARQWPGYSRWLPLVAAQVAARNGGAFGARGVMQQNLQNSQAYAQAARQYRDWSQRTQRAVTDQRNASSDRNHQQFREALGNVRSYDNPHDARAPVELPATYQYYWVNGQGTYVGTNDPGDDPNVGSTQDWRRMPRRD
jgi:hypothetical protein